MSHLDRSVVFRGGEVGAWKVVRIEAVIGESLATVPRLEISPGEIGAWILRGVASNHRYTERREREQLEAVQEGLGRASSTCAALIPIKKSDLWWSLAQDERRAIFEERSHHIAIGLEYLPPISRKLYHCRELGEPFDFLTWFEYAPEHEGEFEKLVDRLRRSPEWEFVEREVDLRLAL